MEVKFSVYILENYSNIKFHENPSSWIGTVPCGLTDRHEANSRFSQFCEGEWTYYRILRMREKRIAVGSEVDRPVRG
jgi:hypothetical protein